jgi:hypothetical protein
MVVDAVTMKCRSPAMTASLLIPWIVTDADLTDSTGEGLVAKTIAGEHTNKAAKKTTGHKATSGI